MPLREETVKMLEEENRLKGAGAAKGIERQKRLNRLTARERIRRLLDDPQDFLELGIFRAFGMYEEWGGLPAAGVITGIGRVSRRLCMIVANDALFKAGAMFPQSIKKVLRAQKIAWECRLPVIYLVDSSGVFLPLQEEIFPDEDDFGRIFRNNALFKAAGIPQIAAILGNCIAGGAYLPLLCDTVVMTEGSGLYLAGPALVKAAIGHEVEGDDLGGARMHAALSGSVDFYERDDRAAIEKVRALSALFPEDPLAPIALPLPEESGETLYDIVKEEEPYDIRNVLLSIVDRGSLLEAQPLYGKTLLTAFASIGGIPLGIVASQRLLSESERGGVEIGGVIYKESADKAAHFILECNQLKRPLLFLQDVMGFMVGKEAEASGIIRAGAKLIEAISSSKVPKMTLILGNSFGAGHYALSGKAFDPCFLFAWPNAKYAVMGKNQAADTMQMVDKEASRSALIKEYESKMEIRYAAARGWVDAIIAPHKTREILYQALLTLSKAPFPLFRIP